jgi:hypothetical protein
MSVEKEGFVAWQSDVTIQPGRIVEERINLVPSNDFIQSYESRARMMRIGAWTATGVAAVGAVLFGAFQYRANKLYGNSTTDGTFLYYRQQLVANPGDAQARSRAQSLQNQVNTAQNLSYVGAGMVAVGAGAAAWLWIAGDDPQRYARYREQARLDVLPVPGGAALALAGAF